MTDPLVLRACLFATNAHGTQLRKNRLSTPFIAHPIGVATILAHDGLMSHDAILLAAAMLHDVVVDTRITLDQIADEFGDEIASIVREFTDEDDGTKELKVHCKRFQIESSKQKSERAKHLALADRLESVRDFIANGHPGWSLQQCKGYLTWGFAELNELRGTNAALEAALDFAFAGSFSFDNVSYPCVTPGDQAALLEEYYALLLK